MRCPELIANTTPRLKIKNNKVSIDHPDVLVGELLMMDAFGTGDCDFMQDPEATGQRGQFARAATRRDRSKFHAFRRKRYQAEGSLRVHAGSAGCRSSYGGHEVC